MKDSHANILRAFLVTLNQRTLPLSAEVQQQLHQIGQLLSTDPDQIPRLEMLAYRHVDLKPDFAKAMTLQEETAGSRSKGITDLPDQATPVTHPPTTELDNSASPIDYLDPYRDLLTQLQNQPEPTLLQQAIQVFLADDPVAAANDMISPQSPL